jgi:hypothetical protein
MPPISWLRMVRVFISRPAAKAPTMRGTRISHVNAWTRLTARRPELRGTSALPLTTKQASSADDEIGSDIRRDIGERVDALLRGVDQFCGPRRRCRRYSCGRAHRDGELQLAGLSADQRGERARRVHDGTFADTAIMALKLKNG